MSEEEDDMEMDADKEGDIEDKVDDLEAELEDLRAEFEKLLGDTIILWTHPRGAISTKEVLRQNAVRKNGERFRPRRCLEKMLFLAKALNEIFSRGLEVL